MNKIAFVIPWYGKNISGGAEMECKSIAERLHQSGLKVEILTTCVKDFSSDWNINYHKEGVEYINEVPVRRFKVRKRDVKAFDGVNYKLIKDLPITLEEEDTFFREMVNSPSLEAFIVDNQNEYKEFVFIPYMFGTTYFGSKACKGKATIIPCLHDENYAYMKRMKEMFDNFHKVIFNAEPERVLAQNLYGLKEAKTATFGLGLETEFSMDPDRFKKKYKIEQPFVLYAGRKDVGKKVDLLLQYFEKFTKEGANIELVLIGGGSIDIPRSISHLVHDLGFVDIQDKYDAYAASLCLCQPSTNESFSIVIMESWIAGRPVLVNEGCEVTTHFAKTSRGGLYFRDYDDFKQAILLYLTNKELCKTMGQLGRNFVKQNFDWDIVVERYTKFLMEE
jgi:glycosyltransferase involved in cell wall biosynthesis